MPEPIPLPNAGLWEERLWLRRGPCNDTRLQVEPASLVVSLLDLWLVQHVLTPQKRRITLLAHLILQEDPPAPLARRGFCIPHRLQASCPACCQIRRGEHARAHPSPQHGDCGRRGFGQEEEAVSTRCPGTHSTTMPPGAHSPMQAPTFWPPPWEMLGGHQDTTWLHTSQGKPTLKPPEKIHHEAQRCHRHLHRPQQRTGQSHHLAPWLGQKRSAQTAAAGAAAAPCPTHVLPRLNQWPQRTATATETTTTISPPQVSRVCHGQERVFE